MLKNRELISELLLREGGFVDHPFDTGGSTNFGITAGTLSLHRGVSVSKEDIFNLSQAEAIEIYEYEYIIKPKFDLIDSEELKRLVIDTGVHSGVVRATLWLQEASGVDVDGIIGKITLGAVNSNSLEVFKRYLGLRIRFLGALITRDPKQAVFAKGWFNRISEFLTNG